MAYNVISCQKFAKNTQILKIADFTSFSVGFQAQKWLKIAQKNGSLNRDLLNFLHRHGLYWVVTGDSSCPEVSE